MCILAGLEYLFPAMFAGAGAAGTAAASTLLTAELAGAAGAAGVAGVVGTAGASTAAATGGLFSGLSGGLGTALSIGQTVFGAVSAYQQAEAQKQAAENNAMVAEWQAQNAQKRGDWEAAQIRRKAAAVKGTQRAEFGARGLDLTYGTPADIMDQTDFFSETDVATTRTNAANEAWAYRAQKANYQAQARSSNPWMAGAGALVSGAGKVADRWYAYSMPSVGGYQNPFFRTA